MATIKDSIKKARESAGNSWEFVGTDWAIRFLGETNNFELDMRRQGTHEGTILIMERDIGVLGELLAEIGKGKK